MLIIGTRTSPREVAGGKSFVNQCPSCHQQRNFVECETVRHITLYFIPLIPLGATGERYMKCTGCESCFTVEMRGQ